MTPVPPSPADSSEGTDEPPIMDRRLAEERRSGRDRRADAAAGETSQGNRRSAADRRQGDRRKAPRPVRNINQYDMDADVLEFVNAVNRFREGSGNRFPSAKDILGILRDLGYEKR